MLPKGRIQMGKKNIMIVEDEGIVAKALQNKILKYGYESKCICHTGEEAVQKAKQLVPDLILMDIFLKGKMDGIEAAEIITNDFDIPIIYLTAYANDETLERAKITHPFGYILKPYKDKDLQVSIQMTLYKHDLEKKIKKSEAQYREVVDNSLIAIVSVNEEDSITLWNLGAKKIFGYSQEEVNSLTFSQLVDFDFKEKIAGDSFSNVLLQNLDEGEIVGFHKNGEMLILDISTSQRKEEQATLYTHFMRDVTEKKKTQTQLHHHKEHLRLINRIMRHDLSTQFSIMRSSLKLFQKRKESMYIDGIEESINRSIQLIRKMRDLEFYLSTHSQLQIYRVRDVFDKVLEHDFGMKIDLRGNCSVLADDAIFSVFENIINNAKKHGQATKLEIIIQEKGRLCEIRIADNGKGIANELKERIFEENFTYGDAKHTGIGLYIVKKAMENYSGSVYVEDNIPKGTVFVLILRTITNRG